MLKQRKIFIMPGMQFIEIYKKREINETFMGILQRRGLQVKNTYFRAITFLTCSVEGIIWIKKMKKMGKITNSKIFPSKLMVQNIIDEKHSTLEGFQDIFHKHISNCHEKDDKWTEK